MATSQTCGVPLWVDSVPMSGQTPMRTYDVGSRVWNAGTASVNQVPSGVFPGTGAMGVVAASGMHVVVQAGYCCVANSSSSLQGGYIFGLMTSATLDIAAADTVNPRIDLVCATVNDHGDSTSTSLVQVITGTPATPPVAPSAPANSLTLATVTVAANVVSVVAGNIADARSYVVAPGGILPIQNAAAAPAVPATQFMYNLATGQLVQGTGTAGTVAVPSTLKWAPQLSVISSAVHAASGGALTLVTSVSVTVDGSTDIEVYAKWPGVLGTAGLLKLFLVIDSTTADTVELVSVSSSQATGGGSVRYFTSAGQSNTPAAGTHTIALKFQASGGGTSTSDGIFAAAGAVALLRVSPVVA